MNLANISAHVDFDEVGIFGPRKGRQGRLAAGTDLALGRQGTPFLDHRQVWPPGAAMALASRRLATRTRKIRLARWHRRWCSTLLAPFAIESLLEIADFRLRTLQLLLE